MAHHTAEMHKDHRKRLRERYKRDGIDSLEDYRALELFLFNCIPMKDTYPIAHNLLERFGSIDKVFCATEEELCAVDGVGEKTAHNIKFTGDFMQKLVSDIIASKPFDSTEQITSYLLWTMRKFEVDDVLVMYLDRKNKLIEAKNYALPKNTYLNVFDEIKEKSAEKKGLKVVVAHKHTEGNPEASFTDIRTTETLVRICKEHNVKFVEHYVVSGYTCHGIAENDLNEYGNDATLIIKSGVGIVEDI